MRVRQQALFTLRCVAAGLMASAAVGLALGVARLGLDLDLPLGTAAAVLATGPLLGLLRSPLTHIETFVPARQLVPCGSLVRLRAVAALAALEGILA